MPQGAAPAARHERPATQPPTGSPATFFSGSGDPACRSLFLDTFRAFLTCLDLATLAKD